MQHIVKNVVIVAFSIVLMWACGNNTSMSNGEGNDTSENNCRLLSQDSSTVFRTRPVENTRLPEQRIYLWDVSESLGDKGNNLWTPLQTNLISAIESIPVNPLNRIVLIPFYSNPQTPIEEYATEEGKSRIIKAIREKGSKPVSDVSLGGHQCTNIAAAIQKFHQLAELGYKNYMFLYTDGKQEDSKGRTCMSILADELDKWSSNAPSNIKKYGFYYLVHPDADNPYIHNTERSHNNFWVIDKADVSIKIIGFPDEYPYNVYDKEALDTNNLAIGIEGDYNSFGGNIKLDANDSLFDFSFIPNVKDGYVEVKVTPKRGYIAEGTYPIAVSVGYDGEKSPYSFIENTSFVINCINKREHSAEVYLKMERQDDNIGRTSYYPSFCLGLSEEKVVSQKAKLEVKYNVFAERKDCAFDISFVDGEKTPLKYDEFKIVADGDTLSSDNPYLHITGTKAIQLEFIPSEVTTDTHFAGYVVSSNPSDMDRINGVETNCGDSVISEWSFKHEKEWNPLKKTIIIVLTLILIGLAIWFLFIQRICYPRFKGITKILVWGHPIMLKFKNYRKVVLTPNSLKQSKLSAFFSGRINYVTIPDMVGQIELYPENKGKKIGFRSKAENYICNPEPIDSIKPSIIIDVTNNIKYTIQ